jgi:RNA polymerase sigma factor (sigma-70 family)
MTESSTEEILDMIRKDDRRVWNIIYRKHGIMLKDHILKNDGTQEDARDFLQETMAAAFVNMKKPGFKLTCKLSTYLFSILKFKWLAELKLRGSKKTMTLDDNEYTIPDNTSELEIIEKEELFNLVDKYLSQLRDKCQEIIKRFYMLKHKMPQIAIDLNYGDANSAKNQKARCMKELRNYCKNAKGGIVA